MQRAVRKTPGRWKAYTFKEVVVATFEVITELNQLVTKEVRLLIKARDEESAALKAHAVLQEYPEPIEVKGVEKILTTRTKHWIPRDVQIKNITKEK
jgi:hypothetical protein